MASGTYTWQVHGLRSSESCLYGPSFQIGCRLLQLHLHTPAGSNRWPEPSALFLRVVSDGCEVPTERLRIHATFEVPKLHFSGGLNVKDSLARWQGGFGPSQSAQFNEVLSRFAEDRLTIKVVVEILEVEALNTTVLRWPLGHFKTLRDAAPCEAGFHHRLRRRVEVQAPDIGVLCFRIDLNPNIDATGNLHVSVKLERADQSVDNLELLCNICLEEVGYSSSFEPVRGSCRDWSRDLEVAGGTTSCPALRKYSGPLTMQLSLTVKKCKTVDMIPDRRQRLNMDTCLSAFSPHDATSLSPTTARSSLTSAQLTLASGPGSPGPSLSARSSRQISESFEMLKEAAVS